MVEATKELPKLIFMTKNNISGRYFYFLQKNTSQMFPKNISRVQDKRTWEK